MPLAPEDLFAIQQLYARYNHAIDFGDADGWAACFTEDGVFSAPGTEVAGRESLRTFAADFSTRMRARHWTNNLLIDGDGDVARGRCYLALLRLGEEGVRIAATGRYEDELVRAGEGWRFRRRTVTMDS